MYEEEDEPFSSARREKEKTSEMHPSTPVFMAPYYTDEDLKALVKFVERMTILFALDNRDWTPEIEEVIKKWFLEINELMLVIFYDDNTLTACLSLPSAPVHNLTYFLREPDQIFTKDNFHDEVMFGTLNDNVDGSLLTILEKIYAPIIFTYHDWTKNLKAHFYNALHKFLSFLTGLHYKMSGMTVLYIPTEGCNLKVEEAALDRDIVQRLEAVTVFWTSQIRSCLSEKQQLVPYDIFCPIDEYNFWLYRYEILNCLSSQLNHEDALHIIKILQTSHSISIKQTCAFAHECEKEMEQARSNIRFLQLLEYPCSLINLCNNPSEIPLCLPQIIHTIRYIWLNSPYYNTTQYLTELFRALSNQILIFCRNKIEINKILDGEPRFGIKMASMAIDCCTSYKLMYEIMSKQHADANPEVGWSLDNGTIFNSINAFIQRLNELIDICTAMIVFGRLDETETIAKPRFGGSRGPEFEKACEEVEIRFLTELNRIKKNSKNAILNVHSNKWNEDVVKYKKMIKENEEIVENLMSNVFFSACNVEEGVEALITLFFYSARLSLRKTYLQKISEIWTKFTDEITKTNLRLGKELSTRNAWIPKYASKSIILKINLNKLKRLHDRLLNADWLPEVPKAKGALEEYARLEANFTKQIESFFDKWSASVDEDLLIRMNRTLIRYSKVQPGLLECNIDPSILEILEENDNFEALGFTTPRSVALISAKKTTTMLTYNSVITVVLDYNKILSVLSPVERKLFRAAILSCERRIRPGILSLTWAGELSDSFVMECAKLTSQLQDFIETYKKANIEIGNLCENICGTYIVKLPSKTSIKLPRFINLVNEQKNKGSNKISELYKSVLSLIAAVYVGFDPYIESMTVEWLGYVRRFDEMIEEAFLTSARNSLASVFTSLHGEGKMGPTPLISIEVFLVDKSIIFEPTLEEIRNYFQTIQSQVVESLEKFPRVCQNFHLPIKGLQQFSDMVSKDKEFQKRNADIINEVEYNEKQLLQYLRQWESFAFVWETDKDQFLAEFETPTITAVNFDSLIEHYSNLASKVLSEQSRTPVHFTIVFSNHLADSILDHIDIWQQRLSVQLLERSDRKMKEIYTYMSDFAEAIKRIPRTIEELRTSIDLLELLLEESITKYAEFPGLYEHFNILDKHEVPVAPELRELVNNLGNEWERYLKILKEAEEMISNYKDEFKLNLLQDAETLKNNAKQFLDDFIESMPTSSTKSPAESREELRAFRKKLNGFYAKEKQLQSDLGVFRINQQENADLQQIEKELDLLEEVWDLVDQWRTSWNDTRLANFWQINISDLEDNTGALYKKINKLYKVHKDKKWDMLEETRNEIIAFQRTLPLLTALKNKSMRGRHWERVRNTVGIVFDENSENFNLEAIMKMNFRLYSDDIQDISNAATMELQIENGIKTIREIWENMTISMGPYGKDVYRIKSVEDCFIALEENMVQISAMKATRFVEPFAKEVDYWERTLSYIAETLEQALSLQKNWIYLENIFTGEDIQKQLPDENRLFLRVTEEWRTITTGMYNAKTAVEATHFRKPPLILNKVFEMGEELEKIQRALEVYLEAKRQLFPRFYFISNDDLLEILSNAKNPDLVQTHLKKLFDNLYKLELKKIVFVKSFRWEARGIYAADGEYVEFMSPNYIEGPVEYWLNLIEDSMRLCLKVKLKQTRISLKLNINKREKWLPMWPGQLCLTAMQILWTFECTKSLVYCKYTDSRRPLKKLRKKQNQTLSKLSEMSRMELPKQMRLKVNTMITVEIHGRDVIEKMYKMNCKDVSHFEWFSQMRFYWDRVNETCVIRQTNTENYYGYEYTGNSGRLVITPLTDRCYITLTTALHCYRGGSPKGPAGTGKTETVKDLGKALGMWVIVTNCSDGLDYKSIGKCFSGLAQTGAWGCFDEFNRINIEVLSVVAQQILAIFQGLQQKLTMFYFEGYDICLKPTIGLFITMNPGYAGRTELPDNLKSMFRPISMMVPDNIIIAENLLFSDGFQNTKSLSKKVFTLYELAKQQLSKQSHYDFGLRSMVALLRYAGLKRRMIKDANEEEVVYLAMKDMNMARLTSNDLPLFLGIMSDIFPGVTLPEIDYSDFAKAIKDEFGVFNLTMFPTAMHKVIELYETKNSRHSSMIIGNTGAAKSATWKVLQAAYNRMKKNNYPGWEDVQVYPINPKALNEAELYGEYNLATGEWLDGVISAIMRTTCADETLTQKWILFDGPVDAVWIENMNSVMDDNKLLTLINSERITMPAQVSLLFEVQDLAVASPATVSRCGMVFNDYYDWGWRPYVSSWLKLQRPAKYVTKINEHFERYLDPVLDFKRKMCQETVPMDELNGVQSLCHLLENFCTPSNGIRPDNDEMFETMTKLWFLFCLVWSVCATVDEQGRLKMDSFLRELEGAFPLKDTIYDYYVEPRQMAFSSWEDKLSSSWRYKPGTPFYQIIVPTVDTVRYKFLVSSLLFKQYPVLLVGPVGTGKSATAVSVVDSCDKSKYSYHSINLSAQTTSGGLQESIESKTEKRTKSVYVPVGGKRMICFMDDFNMPVKDVYGSQPPQELIRFWIDYKFWYNRKTQLRIFTENVYLLAAMGPAGGGRQVVSPRNLSRFYVLNLTFPTESTINRIYGTLLGQQLSVFNEEVKQIGKYITAASISLYNSVVLKLLPTPAKMHYLFNLRDISKIFQGLLRSHEDYHFTRSIFLRLWVHEVQRVFSDRLVDDSDIRWFSNEVNEILGQNFETTLGALCPDKMPPIFGDFMSNLGYYEDLSNIEDLKRYLTNQLNDYNSLPGVTRLDLVFFRDAMEHITRIVRVLSQPRGHVMIIAIGGSGRQCLSRLASFICELSVFTIEVTKNYKVGEFRDDLKTLYRFTGVKNKPTAFIFTNEQVVTNAFLEIINNMLSTGEINLFKADEIEDIRNELEPVVKKQGIIPSLENIMEYFMKCVRLNLHTILCMSPIGDKFRSYIRQYPALINCTTIDWFREWPQEALLEVAKKLLLNCKMDVSLTPKPKELFSYSENVEEKLHNSIAYTFSAVHTSVLSMSNVMLMEAKRHNYVTPNNYIELVNGFQKMLEQKRLDISQNANKLRNGISKVQDTADKVSAMSEELVVSQGKVSELQASCREFLVVITKETKEADEQKQSVAIKSVTIAQEEIECKAMAEQAMAELEEVMPILDQAVAALDSLNKKDVSEVKSYAKPPPKVEKVMEAVLILLQKEPTWAEAKRQLGEANFLENLRKFDKDNISDKTLKRIQPYTKDPELEPEKVGVVSLACKSLSLWIRAIENYGRVYRVVAPKKAKLEEALASLRLKQNMLTEAQRKLAEVNARLAQLQADFDEKTKLQTDLERRANSLRIQVERAIILVESLSGERLRWVETVRQLDFLFGLLVGDCLLGSAFLSYFGPFDLSYRQQLFAMWKKELLEQDIPGSESFSVINFLCDPVTSREWSIQGLPMDAFSTENGIIITKNSRWPLVIDPQTQVQAWIKKLEYPKLKVIDFGQSDYLTTVEFAIQQGYPVLLQNIGETIDPTLNPVLKKAIFIQGGMKLIKFNDKQLSYSDDFRFYITTKLSNPHYPPEISTKTSVVNFAIKESGLQAQLLGILVRKEKPILEEEKDNLVMTIARSRKMLIDLDNDILRLLNESKGSILENDELFNTLQVSRKTSVTVKESLQIAEVTEVEIDTARQAYEPAAERSSILFFVLMDMSRIDPMYQFSLNSYFLLFSQSIDRSEPHSEVAKRIAIINEYHTYATYKSTCRGLFERHKLLFSTHICAKILTNASSLDLDEYTFLLKGGVVVDRQDQIKNPAPDWITPEIWDNLTELEKLPAFSGLCEEAIGNDLKNWKDWYMSSTPETTKIPMDPETELTELQSVLILRCFRPDRISFALTSFIANNMGQKFIEPPVLDFKTVLDESSPQTPLIFILSPGVDPTAALLQLAEQQEMLHNLYSLSLGQGQAPIATKRLKDGVVEGHWVFLANCHLSLSWMPALDKLLEVLYSKVIHPNFRLWLSSSPNPEFPISILQSGIKITTEPPRGIKANLKRLYQNMSEEQFTRCLIDYKYKPLLFSLCFFHSILLERRKFQQLGWNVIYSFNDSDFEISENLLVLYLDEYVTETPWDALKYLISGVNYGGHVTDDWDRRLLATYIDQYFNDNVLDIPNYKLSQSPYYYIPADQSLIGQRDYIETLPGFESPLVFGQHANAEIASLISENFTFFEILCGIQMQTAKSVGESKEEKVLSLSFDIAANVPATIDYEGTKKLIGANRTPLNVILLQEIERYNRLLNLVTNALEDLQKGIQGLAVMSPDVEEVFSAVYAGRVPLIWLKAYPSMKPLGAWARELVDRIHHFAEWATTLREPALFWLAAFTFPTGFLTAVLQTAARATKTPIDELGWEYTVFSETNEEVAEVLPDSGAYIRGLFLEGAGWNREDRHLQEPKLLELISLLPVIHFKPTDSQKRRTRGMYQCPCYYFPQRSSSYITAIDLNAGKVNADFWIKRGTAALLSLPT